MCIYVECRNTRNQNHLRLWTSQTIVWLLLIYYLILCYHLLLPRRVFLFVSFLKHGVIAVIACTHLHRARRARTKHIFFKRSKKIYERTNQEEKTRLNEKHRMKRDTHKNLALVLFWRARKCDCNMVVVCVLW